MELTAENVAETMKYVLLSQEEVAQIDVENFNPDDPDDGLVVVRGITDQCVLHEARLNQVKDDIKSMLSEFGDKYSGGASFLEMCDKENGKWADQHQIMETLLILGLAAGFITMSSRDSWSDLPNGMPMVMIDLNQ